MNSRPTAVSYMEDFITHAIHSRAVSKSRESVPQHSWNVNLSIWLQTTVSWGRLSLLFSTPRCSLQC